MAGTIQRITGNHSRKVSDLLAYEAEHDPDHMLHESNVQSVLVLKHQLFALDAAGNTFFQIDKSGDPILKEVFGNETTDGGVEYQAVPSGIVTGPDGALYIVTLTGAPFPEGESKVWRWTSATGLHVYADGFTGGVDVAFGPDGSLYVVEIFAGRVVRMYPDGHRAVVADGLNFPSGITVGRADTLYVSNCGICAGNGEVLQIDQQS